MGWTKKKKLKTKKANAITVTVREKMNLTKWEYANLATVKVLTDRRATIRPNKREPTKKEDQMSRTTLSQYKDNLALEAADIEKLMERRHATPEKIERLKQIQQSLEVVEQMKNKNKLKENVK